MRAAHLLRRSRLWPRRVLALLLFVLQSGVALSPLAEHAGRRTVNHAEQRGTRHAATHNEATCVVCAVRSLHAQTQSHPAVAALRQRVVAIPTQYRHALVSRDPPAANASRAPPALS